MSLIVAVPLFSLSYLRWIVLIVPVWVVVAAGTDDEPSGPGQ